MGWRRIVDDLCLYLTTGVHGRRHMRPWPDFGAHVRSAGGGLEVSGVRPDTVAAQLGLVDGDLVTVLCGAPVSSHGDLDAVMRVHEGSTTAPSAECVRDGSLVVLGG